LFSRLIGAKDLNAQALLALELNFMSSVGLDGLVIKPSEYKAVIEAPLPLSKPIPICGEAIEQRVEEALDRKMRLMEARQALFMSQGKAFTK
jgi:hypothetical protein